MTRDSVVLDDRDDMAREKMPTMSADRTGTRRSPRPDTRFAAALTTAMRPLCGGANEPTSSKVTPLIWPVVVICERRGTATLDAGLNRPPNRNPRRSKCSSWDKAMYSITSRSRPALEEPKHLRMPSRAPGPATTKSISSIKASRPCRHGKTCCWACAREASANASRDLAGQHRLGLRRDGFRGRWTRCA